MALYRNQEGSAQGRGKSRQLQQQVTPPKLKAVRDRLAQVEAENVAKWGRFLATG
jgi:hypothetical protein